MKAFVICVFFAVVIAAASAGWTCMTEKDRCGEDECCVKFGLAATCKKLGEIDQTCEVHPGKMPFRDHVYLAMCECAKGLKCLPKDGLIGKVLGTCQEDYSGEEE
ncbi:uncharacterized protein LOC129225232 [Uloborus diversus]|uniref:uncharacterized protein LOC129225232 n=1 Tax=Uloborus diversus TaxID=327109 RepID=UPI00240A9435|nr:uncharacterized protein LOC129225232 [Uloborus diversus]